VDSRYYFVPYDLRCHRESPCAAPRPDGLRHGSAHIWPKALLMFDTCEAGSLTERVKPAAASSRRPLGRLIRRRACRPHGHLRHAEAYEGHGGHGCLRFAARRARAGRSQQQRARRIG
jgi:hypothetical protein